MTLFDKFQGLLVSFGIFFSFLKIKPSLDTIKHEIILLFNFFFQKDNISIVFVKAIYRKHLTKIEQSNKR